MGVYHVPGILGSSSFSLPSRLEWTLLVSSLDDVGANAEKLRRRCWGVTPAADHPVYMASCFPSSWRDTVQYVNCCSEYQEFPCGISVRASLDPHVTNHQTSVQELRPLPFLYKNNKNGKSHEIHA